MKKFLSLVLALVMTMSLVTVAGAKDFTDAESVDYAEAVEVLEAVGVISGYTDGSFKPDVQLNRGQAAKIICNLILGPTTAEALPTAVAPFSDVAAGSTFAGYIAYCAQEGIINGYADGTYRPTAPLTGYQFMKMLLGVLGYDAVTEGYVGANYAVAVAKQALALGLNKGLAEAFAGTKVVTRQEAMLFAFNTLKANHVTYDNNSTITVGDIVISTNSSYTKDADPYYVDLFDGDLEKDTDYDAFGRPCTVWTYDNEEIGVYADKATVSYEGNQKIYAIRKDLGLKANDAVAFYYQNNVAEAADAQEATPVSLPVANSSSTAKLADDVAQFAAVGNGVTVEIFYDEDDASYNKIVVIDEYFNDVTSVDKNGDDERYVTINGMDYVTEDFAEDDYVLYTVDEDGIASVKAAEKLTGKVTKVTSAGEYTIGGTTYKLHKGYVANDLAVGTEVDFYLDSYGYIIYDEASELTAALDKLVLFSDKATSGWSTIAKAVYGNGETADVTLKAADYSTFYVYNFTMDGEKVKATVNADYVQNYYTGYTYDFTKGEVAIAGVGNVDNNTAFVYVDADGNTKTYTGYKNAPSFENANVVFFQKATAKAAALVYVFGGTVTDSAENLTYVIVDSYDRIDTTNAKDEAISYYEYRTLAGDVLKFEASNDVVADYYDSYINAGVIVLNSMSIDGDGLITASPVYGTDVTSVNSSAAIDEVNGIMYFDEAGVALAEDVVVYEIAKDADTFAKKDADDVKATYAGYTYVVNADGEIETLILKKA